MVDNLEIINFVNNSLVNIATPIAGSITNQNYRNALYDFFEAANMLENFIIEAYIKYLSNETSTNGRFTTNFMSFTNSSTLSNFHQVAFTYMDYTKIKKIYNSVFDDTGGFHPFHDLFNSTWNDDFLKIKKIRNAIAHNNADTLAKFRAALNLTNESVSDYLFSFNSNFNTFRIWMNKIKDISTLFV